MTSSGVYGRVLIASYMRWCPPGESEPVHGPRYAVGSAVGSGTRSDNGIEAARRIDRRPVDKWPRLPATRSLFCAYIRRNPGLR